MRPSLLVSCLLLANCLSSSVSRVPCRAAVSTASTHHISRRRGEAKGNCDAIAPSYVAVGGVSGFIQDWGEKIERFKQGCVEIQPKIINLNRRPSDVLRELVAVGSNAGNSVLQGGAMGYCIGRVGLLKGKETMEAYKRFFGDRAHHMLGVKQAKSYATFVCLFGVFEGIPRALRGVDDQWNTVAGSVGVGMYMARRMGTAGMIRSGMTWGAFTLIAERLRGPPKEEGEGGEEDQKKAKGRRSSRRRREASQKVR